MGVIKYSLQISSIVSYTQTVISNSLVDVIFTTTVWKVRPAHVAQWSKHLGAMYSMVRSEAGVETSAPAGSPAKELFQIIPMHMMNRKINPDRKKRATAATHGASQC